MTEQGKQIINHSKWYLVYTKPKQEKRAKQNLVRQGVKVFLPLISKHKVGTDSKKNMNTEALFPRYLFVMVNERSSEISFINSTKGVSNLILFGDLSNSSVPTKVIVELTKILGKNETFTEKVITEEYKAGDRLKIRKGSIEGVEAIFLASSGKKRARVLLELINSSITATLPIDDIGMKESIESIKI